MAKAWARAEMAGAAVWDPRCRTSLTRLCERLAQRPGAAFSTACGADGRQAARRICRHPSTSVPGLLQGHVQQTVHRCQQAWAGAPAAPGPTDPPWLLVAQDTTDLDYTTHLATKGLGQVGRGATHRGLLAHAALALTPAGPWGCCICSCGPATRPPWASASSGCGGRPPRKRARNGSPAWQP